MRTKEPMTDNAKIDDTPLLNYAYDIGRYTYVREFINDKKKNGKENKKEFFIKMT